MLAFYLYPFEPNQKAREYTEDDLKDPKIVEELFDYCQILEAVMKRPLSSRNLGKTFSSV